MSALAAAFLAAGLEPGPEVASSGLASVPDSWQGAPILAWRLELPGPPTAAASRSERSGPAVLEDLVVVGRTGVRGLLVVDRAHGTLRSIAPTSGPVVSAPVRAPDGRLYAADTAGGVHAFTAQGLRTGKAAWTHKGAAPVLSSPSVSGDSVLVLNVEELVVALDSRSGEQRWRHAHALEASRGAALQLYGTPSPMVDSATGTVAAGFADGTVEVLSLKDGELRSSVRVGEGTYPDVIATPVLAGNLLVAGGFMGPLVARPLGAEAPAWRQELGSAGNPSVSSGTILHPGTDGKLRAIDGRTGDVRWTWDSGDGGTLTVAPVNGQLWAVASSEGTLHLVNGQDGKETWSFDPGYELGGFTAPPIVAGGALYALSNAGVLYAFHSLSAEVEAPKEPWIGLGLP